MLGLVPDPEAGALQQRKSLTLLDLKDFCPLLAHLSYDRKVQDNSSSEPSCGLLLSGSQTSPAPVQSQGVAACACNHAHACSCTCADGLYACDAGSPAGRLKVFPSHRKRGGRAHGFSWEHQRKPMFLCCWGGDGQSCLVLLSPPGPNLGWEGNL